MYFALAENAWEAGAGGFAHLTESSQTPGGLNEQSCRMFDGAGMYGHVDRALDAVLARPRSDQ